MKTQEMTGLFKMMERRYDFRGNERMVYRDGGKSGFFTEACAGMDASYPFPELNTGFEPSGWYKEPVVIMQDESGCYVDSEAAMNSLSLPVTRRIPLSFKAEVKPSENYQITVNIRAEVAEEEILIYINRRCLVFKGSLAAGETYSGTFFAAVRDIVPRGETTRFEDYSAEVTVISRQARLAEIVIRECTCPTLYIAGDSTVTDQGAEYPYAPETSYSGWGQMIPYFVSDFWAVSNHAHSGLTTESFRQEGHHAIMMEHMRPGDICLFQFGHNDQKLASLKAEGGYLDNLTRYIHEVRGKGATPVLVTPLARNSWKGNDGSYHDLLAEYADVVKRLGKEEEVLVLDLHQRSMEFIIEHGLEDAKRWFYPSDFTHTNDYGAYQMAQFIWKELQSSPLLPADAEALDGVCDWAPPARVSPFKPPAALLDASECGKQEAVGFSDKVERPDDLLTRAEAVDLVMQAAHFFTVNVYNDLFEDVIGHEWYAGAIEGAVQNGIIPDKMIEAHCFFPERQITVEEFYSMMVTAYRSRKSGVDLSGLISAGELKRQTITRKEAALILDRLDI